jgi:DNA repair protein RadC
VMAQRLLDSFGGLAGVARAGWDQLARARGVGPARAARIAASVEAGARALRPEAGTRRRVECAEDVVALAGPELALLDHEVFGTVLLGPRNLALGFRVVAVGTRDACLVSTQDVFRGAVSEGARAVVLVHNHPSGDPGPSEEDLGLTRRLVTAGRALGVAVLDHVIVAGHRWQSLREAAPAAAGFLSHDGALEEGSGTVVADSTGRNRAHDTKKWTAAAR